MLRDRFGFELLFGPTHVNEPSFLNWAFLVSELKSDGVHQKQNPNVNDGSFVITVQTTINVTKQRVKDIKPS